ncbi:MAG: hypothetical protein ABSB19_03675 [Methylomonas sp.]
MDRSDFFISFSPWIILIISMLISIFIKWDWVIYLGVVIALIIFIYSCNLTYIHNQRNFYICIPVTLAKTTLGFFFVFTLIDIINPSGKTAYYREVRRTNTLIVFTILSVLIGYLINGHAVYQRKDWALPDSDN